MYKAEVLGKLPVVQHFYFGSILAWEGPFPEAHDESHCGHNHANTVGDLKKDLMAWGDCCGIPVPSAFGAANAQNDNGLKLSGPGIKPIPFD